jgi:integrase/recombinase XerD
VAKRALKTSTDSAPPRRHRHPNRALTEDEIRKLLHSLATIRESALIRIGLSVGLRVSEIVTIRTSEVDFDRGLISIWDEKKDIWRKVMPTRETLAALRQYIESDQPGLLVFPMSAKTVERIIQRAARASLGYVISWHSLRTTYVSRSVELEQSPAVVMMNTGDSPSTILKYYTKLPETVMRRFVESKPVILQDRL